MKNFYKSLILLFLVFSIHSCSEDYVTEEGIAGIFIQTDANSKIIGQELTISVKTGDGEDVTNDALIYVNDEVLTSTTYTTDEIGLINVRAEYLSLESPMVEIEYHDGSLINIKKNVLIEDYTGTWCGWCPRVSYAMSLVSDQTDAAVFVAIHRAPVGLYDPFIYEDAGELELLINTPGYPKSFINRLTEWDFPQPENLGQVIALTQGAIPRLGLKMSSSLEDNQITLNVDSFFTNDFQNLKLVVYLLENGLVYPQVNYTSYYNGINPILDYVHDYTLRETLTNIIGDAVPNASSKRGLEYNRTFSFTLPSNVEEVNQVDFVAFLTDEAGNVINVRHSALGDAQEYQIIE